MSKEPKKVDHDLVLLVGGHVMATQLSNLRDPSAVDDAHFDRLADLSVRAALALAAAIPRAEERLAAEAKAEEEAKTAQDKADQAAKANAEDAKKAANPPAAA